MKLKLEINDDAWQGYVQRARARFKANGAESNNVDSMNTGLVIDSMGRLLVVTTLHSDGVDHTFTDVYAEGIKLAPWAKR